MQFIQRFSPETEFFSCHSITINSFSFFQFSWKQLLQPFFLVGRFLRLIWIFLDGVGFLQKDGLLDSLPLPLLQDNVFFLISLNGIFFLLSQISFLAFRPRLRIQQLPCTMERVKQFCLMAASQIL